MITQNTKKILVWDACLFSEKKLVLGFARIKNLYTVEKMKKENYNFFIRKWQQKEGKVFVFDDYCSKTKQKQQKIAWSQLTKKVGFEDRKSSVGSLVVFKSASRDSDSSRSF